MIAFIKNLILNKKRSEKWADILAWSMIFLMGIIYSFMSVRKHYQFQTYGWDTAVFDQGIWQWSNFQFPYSSFHDLPWLGDHFHLILLAVVPFYWLKPGVETLVTIQAFATVLGAVPLYLLSKHLTKHYLFSLAIVASYLLFYSLQWHTFSGFHELAFLPLTFGGMAYFWAIKRKKMYWFSLILTLLVKEEMGFLVAAFGLWSFINDKKRRKVAILTIICGILYSVIMIAVVMPFLAGGMYRHTGYGMMGNTIGEVFVNILKNPLLLLRSMVDSPVKINTMFTTFWPFGFLPIFAPSTLIVALQQFLLRFMDYGKQIRWTPYFAYSLPMASIMAWGSIYGFSNIVNKVKSKKRYLAGTFISFILLTLVIVEDLFLHAPINSIFKKQFYQNESWMDNNRKIIECVPNNVSVSAQNNLAPWLARREEIKVFPEGIGYDFIVLDMHQGLDENAFHFLGSNNTKIVAEDLIDKGYYEVFCQKGDALALTKVKDFDKSKLNYPFEIDIWEK